jgi:signal transduction histidine kinase
MGAARVPVIGVHPMVKVTVQLILRSAMRTVNQPAFRYLAAIGSHHAKSCGKADIALTQYRIKIPHPFAVEGDSAKLRVGEAASPALLLETPMLRTWQPRINLRFLFLLTFALVAMLPAALLAIWIIHSTASREFENTSSKQEMLASTFVIGLDEYARNAAMIYEDTSDLFTAVSVPEKAISLSRSAGFRYFLVEGEYSGLPKVIDLDGTYRQLSASAWHLISRQTTGRTRFLAAMLDGSGKPTIFVSRRSLSGRVVAGALDPKPIRDMRRTVSFGGEGHAVVVDQAGQVLAHPRPEWETTLRDLSEVAPVHAVMEQRVGSMEYFAPSRGASAVAGFSYSAYTGWGVLMVRPKAEIEGVAAQYIQISVGMIAAGVGVAFLLALVMAQVIVRPVERAARAAWDLEHGELTARVDPIPKIPQELADLAATFNRLASRIDRWRRAAAETIADIRASDQAKQDFLSTLSHEVRTPLNAVIGYADLLRSERVDLIGAEQRREYASNIASAGHHLLRLIDEIFDLASIEAGQTNLEPEAIDVAELVAETTAMMRPDAEAQDVHVTVNVPRGLPPLYADRLKLRQVVLNILTNAIKYTPKGGRVSVSAECLPSGKLRLSIKDTGIGMTKEELQTALLPFGRIRSNKTRGQIGLGLGLPLAQRLIETMNGDFVLESNPNAGTNVLMTLPAASIAQTG